MLHALVLVVPFMGYLTKDLDLNVLVQFALFELRVSGNNHHLYESPTGQKQKRAARRKWQTARMYAIMRLARSPLSSVGWVSAV